MNLEALQEIKNAMDKIKNIDRSEYFNNYYIEVTKRIKEIKDLEEFKKKHE